MKYQYGLGLIKKYIKHVFPEVDNQLSYWSAISEKAGDEILAKQALASITHKRFHAQGGSIYALYPGVNMNASIEFIVALQTISDYLDNLCDRAGVYNEAAFRQLHISMLDAVDPDKDTSDYYKFYPHKNDNGYLQSLVEACRQQVSKLPSYQLVLKTVREYIELYSDLQSYKHLALDVRQKRLLDWANGHLRKYPGISAWEFSAATGSTLGVFILFASASNPSLTRAEVDKLEKAYFPWICGLHILLDYYIDLKEDLSEGDLNFTNYYDNLKQCEKRLSFFIDRSLAHCSTLPYPRFHKTVVRGLLALYLSDPKASVGLNKLTSRHLIKKGGLQTGLYYNLCNFLRHKGKI